MRDLRARIEKLSPEKLALLSSRLRAQARELTPIRHACEADACTVLSFAQERLWFLAQMDPFSPVYNLPIAVELRGSLDKAALQASISQVVRRHDCLRANFKSVQGKPVQVISDPGQPVIAYEAIAAEATPAAIADWVRQKVAEPLDIEAGPLFRVYCFSTSDRNILLVIMHHIISDGWSLKIFVSELVAFYSGLVQKRKVEVPELPIQYYDFAIWEHKCFSSGSFLRQLEYWKRQLAGVLDSAPFPTDHPRDRETSSEAASFSIEVPSAAASGFRELIHREEVTPFIAFLAAFQVVLYFVSGREDLVIGSPISGRSRQELENLIGLFANIHVLRTSMAGDPGYRELLLRVRNVVSEAQTHQEFPFQKLVEQLQPVRATNSIPLFQITFTFTDDFKHLPQVPGLVARPISARTGIAMFDLDLNVIEAEEVVTLLFEYKKALFKRRTIARLSRLLVNVLSLVSEKSDWHLSEICAFLQAEEVRFAATERSVHEDTFRARITTIKRMTTTATR
jgi:condensation domain-containing protein